MHFTDHDNDTPIVDHPTVFGELFHHAQPALQPVPVSDGDELLNDLENEQEADTITLEERPDPDKLNGYWSQVHDDLQKDPDWFSFDNE